MGGSGSKKKSGTLYIPTEEEVDKFLTTGFANQSGIASRRKGEEAVCHSVSTTSSGGSFNLSSVINDALDEAIANQTPQPPVRYQPGEFSGKTPVRQALFTTPKTQRLRLAQSPMRYRGVWLRLR